MYLSYFDIYLTYKDGKSQVKAEHVSTDTHTLMLPFQLRLP